MLSSSSALLRVFLLLSIFSVPSMAQEPVAPAPVAPPSNGDQEFERASRVYDYGRKNKDYYASRQALGTAEKAFRSFVQRFPRHPSRQKAEYNMAVCQILTGNTASGEANFERIIRKYRRGHWVGASGYRMGIQKFNMKAYITASKFFKIAADNYEKEELASLALYQHSRSLLLANRYDLAVKPLEELANSDTQYKTNSQYALAKLYYDAKDYAKSLPHFEKLTRTKGLEEAMLADSYLFYGLSLSKVGKTEEALNILKRSLQIPSIANENKAQAQHEIVSINYLAKDYDAVIVQYERGLLPGEPEPTAKSYLYAGYALLKKNYFTRAVSAFDRVISLRPNTQEGFEASYRRVYCYYQIDSAATPSQADAFYNVYRKRDTKNPWHKLAKVYKAETLYHTGQLEDAAKTYRQIDSDDIPKGLQPNFLYKKLICLHDAEEYNRAVKSASHFISNFPNHPLIHEVRMRRGNALLANDNHAAAATDYEKVLEELPESPLAASSLQGLIKVYSKSNRYEELVEASELLIGKFPALEQQPKAHAHYWLGWAHFKLENFADAIPELEKARRLSPKFYKEPAGTRILYSTYYLKDTPAMKSAYTRIMQDVPGKYFPPKMLAWLGIQSYQNEDYLTSRKVLSQIVNRKEPIETPIDVWRYLTKSYLELGQFPDALEAAKVVISLEESSFWKADALLDTATAHLGLGNVDEAISTAKEGLYFEPKGTIESALCFIIADAYANRGDIISAKTEYMLIASKFDGDQTVHPLALWKTALIVEPQDPGAAEALKSTITQTYPDWKPPVN